MPTNLARADSASMKNLIEAKIESIQGDIAQLEQLCVKRRLRKATKHVRDAVRMGAFSAAAKAAAAEPEPEAPPSPPKRPSTARSASIRKSITSSEAPPKRSSGAAGVASLIANMEKRARDESGLATASYSHRKPVKLEMRPVSAPSQPKRSSLVGDFEARMAAAKAERAAAARAAEEERVAAAERAAASRAVAAEKARAAAIKEGE